MMLLQKAPQLPAFANPAFQHAHHRRHPSAPPTVVVQPTRTPGLLSLSKPTVARQSPNRPVHSAQRPQMKHTSTPKQKQPPMVRAQTTTPPAESRLATPPIHLRGRSHGKHAREKPQTPRSDSQSPLRGKHGRQPSPPLPKSQLSSQAEASDCITTTQNHFDPFLDNLPPAPAGKTVRRRQQQLELADSTPTKAIPVPVARPINNMLLSRSEPARASTLGFPVCDGSVDGVVAQPLTASASPVRAFKFSAPDFSTLPSTPRKNRKHHRSPSEGVFLFSSDEEGSSNISFPQARPVFATPFKPTAQTDLPSRGQSASPSSQDPNLPFYASSMFQNSPSPDELPFIL